MKQSFILEYIHALVCGRCWTNDVKNTNDYNAVDTIDTVQTPHGSCTFQPYSYALDIPTVPFEPVLRHFANSHSNSLRTTAFVCLAFEKSIYGPPGQWASSDKTSAFQNGFYEQACVEGTLVRRVTRVQRRQIRLAGAHFLFHTFHCPACHDLHPVTCQNIHHYISQH